MEDDLGRSYLDKNIKKIIDKNTIEYEEKLNFNRIRFSEESSHNLDRTFAIAQNYDLIDEQVSFAKKFHRYLHKEDIDDLISELEYRGMIKDALYFSNLIKERGRKKVILNNSFNKQKGKISYDDIDKILKKPYFFGNSKRLAEITATISYMKN